MLEKEFIPYKQALELKELGFNKKCLGYWSDWVNQEPFLITCEIGTEIESCRIRRKNFLCKAPTLSQAFRWFREKGYDINIQKEYDKLYYGYYFNVDGIISISKSTYDEVELECLKFLINILKNDENKKLSRIKL